MARFKVLEKKERDSNDSEVITPTISKRKKKERNNKQRDICKAILDKRLMTLSYTITGTEGSGSAGSKGSGKRGGGIGAKHGAAGDRTVEPYIYEMTKRGNPALRCYQLEGPSGSGESSGWKLFLVDNIRNLDTLDDHFVGALKEYNKSASASYACAVS
jgi:hypothetical protein